MRQACRSPRRIPSEIGDEQAHNASNDSASRRFHDPTPVQHGYRARSSRATNPVFPVELVGQPWDFEPKYALAASGRGSALHLSVTALSVKKALIGSLQVEKLTRR